MNTFKLSFGFWFGLVVVVVFGGLLWFMFHKEAAKTNFVTNATTREIALSCTTDMATQFHIHPTLKIVFDGVDQIIPTDIGVTPGCMHPLHTHETGGKLHVESPVQRDFTLADFFTVWEKPFSQTQIMDKVVTGTAKLTMTINGQAVDTFENTVLKDMDVIVITYTSK